MGQRRIICLISDVLFVPDRKDPNLYHPRIGVQHDFIYRALNDWEKQHSTAFTTSTTIIVTMTSGNSKP